MSTTLVLSRPPSSSHTTGGIGDGFIYPVKSKPKSTTTYYAKPLHPLPPIKPSKPKPQIYKVIIKDQPAAKKVTKGQEQVYKIVHVPSQGGGGGGGDGHHSAPSQNVKVFKIIQFKQDGGAGGGGGHHSAGKWSR